MCTAVSKRRVSRVALFFSCCLKYLFLVISSLIPFSPTPIFQQQKFFTLFISFGPITIFSSFVVLSQMKFFLSVCLNSSSSSPSLSVHNTISISLFLSRYPVFIAHYFFLHSLEASGDYNKVCGVSLNVHIRYFLL